jgi:NAD(P)-dependent dehydrogenase (short-subunit alcohol dehydrogenase family)
VRTVALAPGLTDTPGLRASVGDDYIARVASAYPGGRIGLPEDIVALTVFLCSDAAGHISGTLLPGTG